MQPKHVSDNFYAPRYFYNLCVQTLLQSRNEIHKEIEEAGSHSLCLSCRDDKVKAQDSHITAQLTEEHKEIARNFKQLNTAHSANNSRLFNQLTNALDAHFKKEEQLLFPRLTRRLGSFVCDKLSFEHMQILRAAQAIGEHQDKTSIGRLEQLFLAHSNTEENVLFWYLDTQSQIKLKLV